VPCQQGRDDRPEEDERSGSPERERHRRSDPYKVLRREDLPEGDETDDGGRDREQELALPTRAAGEERPYRKERRRLYERRGDGDDFRGRAG
jgi:hypothetical protein